MNFGGESHLCLDAEIALSQASDKHDENKVSKDDGENGSGPQPGKLVLQGQSVACQARLGTLESVYEIFHEKIENSQCREIAIPAKYEERRIADGKASGERH